MMDIRDLRTQIGAWISRSFPDATRVDGGGQRLVYHVPSASAALKVWGAGDASQHERHVREVSALERIDHPSLPRIVAPIAQIEIEGQVLAFYLEEWLDAPSLKSQIADLPLDEQQFRRIGATVADAVEALHDSNIVHRDISLGG